MVRKEVVHRFPTLPTETVVDKLCLDASAIKLDSESVNIASFFLHRLPLGLEGDGKIQVNIREQERTELACMQKKHGGVSGR